MVKVRQAAVCCRHDTPETGGAASGVGSAPFVGTYSDLTSTGQLKGLGPPQSCHPAKRFTPADRLRCLLPNADNGPGRQHEFFLLIPLLFPFSIRLLPALLRHMSAAGTNMSGDPSERCVKDHGNREHGVTFMPYDD